MKVIAFDPFLSPRARDGAGRGEGRSWTSCCRRADFITLHAPLTEQTRNILDAAALAQAEEGRARSSTARAAAWSTRRRCTTRSKSGHVAGAALDVFDERAGDQPNPLFGAAERGLHAASGRRDRRGAGERGAAGGRADGRLPADRRRHQRHQHA
jgi:D-3-phosphoglycerate dehydrogenase